MHPVAYIELISALACLTALVFVVCGWKRSGFLRAIPMLIVMLLLLMMFYGVALFLEWSGLGKRFQWHFIEDFASVFIPFIWAFVFYAIVKNTVEKELRASRRYFRNLVESTSDWIWEVDSTGHYTYASPRVEAILGYAPEEVLGKTPFDLMGPEESERIRVLFVETAARQEPFHDIINVNLHKDGREVVLETNGMPVFDHKGNLTGYRGIDRDITTRLRVEREQKQKQAEMDSVFRASPAGIGLVRNRTLVRGNERFFEITGYPKEEMIGADPRRLYQSDKDYLAVGEKYAEAITKGFTRVETQFIRKDRSVIDVVLYISPLDRKDADAGFVVVLQDITDFKAARQQVLAEKARAQTYLNVVDVIILVLDTAGSVTMINKKGCELLERSAEQIQGIDWFNVCLPPSYRQISRNAFQRIVDGDEKSVSYFETPIQTAGGIEKLIAWRNTALRDASGKIVGVVSSGLDITESRDAEEARRISEQRLRVALSAAQMGTWRWEAATGLLSRDANLNEMLGLPAEEVTERVDDFFNYVHLDDQVAAKTEFERAVLERDTFLSRFRIIRSDGSVRSVLDQGKPFYDFNGQLEYVTGVVVDITEQTEYQLRYQNIINSAPMGILTYELDADDRLVLTGANQAANTILGVSFSVSIGKTIEEVFPELGETELPKEYRRICKEGGIYHGDNFEYHDAHIGGFYEFDAFQTFPGNVAVAFTDVTERMRTQTQLRFTQFAVDHAGEAAYWMGPDAKFIYVNEKACDSMGYTRDELLQMSVPDIDPDFPRESWGDHWNDMRQKGVDRFESHHKTKDGTVFPVEITSNFVTFENQEYICAFARDITVRKKAEEGLRKSEKRNRAWLENSPVCTKILDLDFNLQYMSKAGIIGLQIEDITEFYGKPYPFNFYPESFRNTMTKNLEKARETGEIIEQEAPVVDIEGNELWFHSTIVPIYDDEGQIDYIMVVSSDITERIEAEHQREVLMRKLQFTQFAFDNAGEAAEWVDFEENYVYVNDMVCEELGYPREELMQMKVNEIDPFYPREDWEKHWDEMRELGVKRFEGRHVRKDGTIFPVEITSKFVTYEGKEYICSFERDITERKVAEQKREVLAKQLQNRNDELQSIVFAAAHDLRTPLVNIAGFTGELEKSLANLAKTLDGVSMDADVAERIDFLLKTDVPESLGFVKFGNQQMDMLLGGLMRLSRVGTASVKETTLDMYHLLDSVVQGFKYQTNKLDIDLSIQEDLPDCIGDYSLLAQVFINLLDNAIKYRHPDRKAVIKMGGTVQDDMAEYTIIDNGIGIEPDQLDKVFDLFHQLHIKPDAKGQGLGLTIVRRIMDRQQGSVEIESTPEEGTTVYVRLPKA